MLHGSAGWRRELGGVGRRPFPDAWISAVPFKAKAAYRRHIAKQRHGVTNWAEYDAGLRARGSLMDGLVHAGGNRGLGGSAAVQAIADAPPGAVTSPAARLDLRLAL